MRAVALVGVVLCLWGSAGCRVRRAPARPEVTSVEMAESSPRLVSGFYDAGGQTWRWTQPSFAVSLDIPKRRDKLFVVLSGVAPAELMSSGQPATLTTKVNGILAGTDTFTKTSDIDVTHEIPSGAVSHSPALVEFSLDRKAEDGPKGEPRGLIVLKTGVFDETRTPAFKKRIWDAGKAEYKRIYGERPHGFTPEQNASLMSLFHDLRIWDSLQFLGVPILKNPLDLWLVQKVIYEVRPDFIVETGTFRGGSALFWAHTLEGLGLHESRVLTVDIGDYCGGAAAHSLWRRYVEFARTSSTDEKLVERWTTRVKGKRVIVMLDSNHEAAHVLDELRLYSPMVSRGSYLIVEDGHIDGVPTQPNFGPGPFAATTEFLQAGGDRDFERDLSREDFGTSFNVGGWLRRR